jgi:hypothetical protein
MSSIGQVSSWSILVLAGFGIIVNIASVVILVVKGRNQMFHHLLKIMALYDLVSLKNYHFCASNRVVVLTWFIQYKKWSAIIQFHNHQGMNKSLGI